MVRYFLAIGNGLHNLYEINDMINAMGIHGKVDGAAPILAG